MKDMMKYKGYFGSVHFSDEDNVFYGRVEFIRALISYEGTDVASLRSSFEEAVDDYIETCKEHGKEPEQPFKGSFNIRVGSALHQRIALEASKRSMTLNRFIIDVLEKEIGERQAA